MFPILGYKEETSSPQQCSEMGLALESSLTLIKHWSLPQRLWRIPWLQTPLVGVSNVAEGHSGGATGMLGHLPSWEAGQQPPCQCSVPCGLGCSAMPPTHIAPPAWQKPASALKAKGVLGFFKSFFPQRLVHVFRGQPQKGYTWQKQGEKVF